MEEKEKLIGLVVSKEIIEVGHYVTVYYDEEGNLRIRKSTAKDSDTFFGFDAKLNNKK